ncbi:MAG: RNA polymerase factor sigma-32 [Magnetococcales bacterium]|nr:RNA polymerase factor sigma-32 [Magnetococcales bacterium]
MSNHIVARNDTWPLVWSDDDYGFRSFVAKAMEAPILTVKEESDLFTRFRIQNDTSAAQTLVFSHLRLVYSASLDYRGYGIPLPDLVQEGTIGLMQAVKKFDPLRGVRLAAYAIWWIRAAIHEFILKSWSLVKIATTTLKRKLFYKLRQSKSGFAPLNREEAETLATQFGTDPDTIIEMDARLSGKDVSLDQPILDDDGNRVEILPDARPGPEARAISLDQQRFLHAQVEKGIDDLDPRERIIIRERFQTDHPKTLDELARLLSLSRERVRQLEKKALGKLKKHLLATAPIEDFIPNAGW